MSGNTNKIVTGGAILFALIVVIGLARYSMPQAKPVILVTPIPTAQVVPVASPTASMKPNLYVTPNIDRPASASNSAVRAVK